MKKFLAPVNGVIATVLMLQPVMAKALENIGQPLVSESQPAADEAAQGQAVSAGQAPAALVEPNTAPLDTMQDGNIRTLEQGIQDFERRAIDGVTQEIRHMRPSRQPAGGD